VRRLLSRAFLALFAVILTLTAVVGVNSYAQSSDLTLEKVDPPVTVDGSSDEATRFACAISSGGGSVSSSVPNDSNIYCHGPLPGETSAGVPAGERVNLYLCEASGNNLSCRTGGGRYIGQLRDRDWDPAFPLNPKTISLSEAQQLAGVTGGDDEDEEDPIETRVEVDPNATCDLGQGSLNQCTFDGQTYNNCEDDNGTITCDSPEETERLGETSNELNEGDSEGNGLFATLYNITSIIVAGLLYIISLLLFIILFFISWITLLILGINPAGAQFLGAIEPAWGAIVGIANLVILGAFMYVGFAYLLGLDSVKKNIGDFILKVAFYAILLNFTLLGTAAFVNIGQGVGNLIKFAYAGNAETGATNRALVGNLLEGIGQISYLRCGSQFSNGEECVIEGPLDGTGQVTENVGELFAGSMATAMTAVISEMLVIIAAGLAIYVMARVLKIVLLRLVGIIFIMALSPIGLASYFSPVDSWQEIGKQMIDRLWKYVAFYPAFIMGLVLVNLLSGSFQQVLLGGDTSAQLVEFSTGVGGADAESDSDSIGAQFQQVFTNTIELIIVLSLSLGGLYAVSEYFLKRFEEDLGKLTSTAVNAAQGAWNTGKKTWGFARDASYIAASPMRALASRSQLDKNIKSSGLYQKIQNLSTSDNVFGRIAGSSLKGGLETLGSALTGRTLIDVEEKAKMAKRIAWDGWVNRGKVDIADRRARQDIENTAWVKTFADNVGLGGATNELLDFTNAPLPGVDAATIRRMRGNVDEKTGLDSIQNLANKAGGAAGAAAFSRQMIERDIAKLVLAEGAFGNAYGEGKKNDALYAAMDRAFKTGDAELINFISTNENLRALAERGFNIDGDFSDEATKRILERDQQIAGFMKDGVLNENSPLILKVDAAAANPLQPTAGLEPNDLFDPRVNKRYREAVARAIGPDNINSPQYRGAMQFANQAERLANSIDEGQRNKYLGTKGGTITTPAALDNAAIAQLALGAQTGSIESPQDLQNVLNNNPALQKAIAESGAKDQKAQMSMANKYIQYADQARTAAQSSRRSDIDLQLEAIDQAIQAGGPSRLTDVEQAQRKAGFRSQADQIANTIAESFTAGQTSDPTAKPNDETKQTAKAITNAIAEGLSRNTTQSDLQSQIQAQFGDISQLDVVQDSIRAAYGQSGGNESLRQAIIDNGRQVLESDLNQAKANLQAEQTQAAVEAIEQTSRQTRVNPQTPFNFF
jgi:hypothetical protein